MSNYGQEANPFADPFNSPFNDPSITQATSNQTTTQSTLEDYNPFASQTTRPTTQVRGATNPQIAVPPPPSQPAVLQTSTPAANNWNQQPPPPYHAGSGQVTSEDLHRRQEELERKAAELAQREEALRQASVGIREPNWPPVPKICPFGPCLYQDIAVEIPVEFQKLVRQIYYLWMYYVFVLFLNLLGGIAILWATKDAGPFGLSIMCLIFFSPLSFLCWFRPIYKAFRNDSSFNFLVFFFVFFCQLVLSVLWAVGIPGTGAVGLMTAFKSISDGHVIYYVFIFIVAISVVTYALASFLVLVKVHSIYRTSGASFAKAQAEFATGVINNQHVQQAASAAVANAARQTMNQTFNNMPGKM